jgi:hypothetical protein
VGRVRSVAESGKRKAFARELGVVGFEEDRARRSWSHWRRAVGDLFIEARVGRRFVEGVKKWWLRLRSIVENHGGPKESPP